MSGPGGNQTNPEPRPRGGGIVIGTGRTGRGRTPQDTPPPTERKVEDTRSEDSSLVISEDEIDWGDDLGGDLGFKLIDKPSGGTSTPTRPRRGVGDTKPLVLGLISHNPKLLTSMAPLQVGNTYKQLSKDDRDKMFETMTQEPDMLGQVIAKHREVSAELMERVMARHDDRLVSQVLKAWGGNNMETTELLKGMVANAGRNRSGLLALGLQCAGDTIDEASDPGTAGRSNTGRSGLISQIGKSGPSKDSIDEAMAGTKASLGPRGTLRPPPGATLEADRLSGKSESEKGVVIQQTIKLVAQVMTQVLDDLHRTAVTPELSMITATMFDKAHGKFNAEEARKQAGGHIFLRIVIPAIFPGLTGGATPDQQNILKLATKGLQSVANGVSFGAKEPYMSVLDPWLDRVKAALDAYVDKVVESGRIYCEMLALDGTLDPTSPADIIQAARDSDALAAKLFADADDEFPLGSRPAETTSPLGRLIEEAALGRSREYNFAEVRVLDDFADLVKTERKEVLEAVTL